MTQDIDALIGALETAQHNVSRTLLEAQSAHRRAEMEARRDTARQAIRDAWPATRTMADSPIRRDIRAAVLEATRDFNESQENGDDFANVSTVALGMLLVGAGSIVGLKAEIERPAEKHTRALAADLGDDPVAASFKQAKEIGARDEQKRRGRRWRG